jgi:hypothetical protein
MIPDIKLARHPDTGEIVPEEWRDITLYEEMYQISNYGRVKSLSRRLKNAMDSYFISKEKLLKPTPIDDGYLTVTIYKNKRRKTVKTHTLVAQAFVLGYIDGYEVNHKDRIRTNNFQFNLEWVTHRENTTHSTLNKKKTSIYTGVSWWEDRKPRNNKWTARIRVDGKIKRLGRFFTEEEAALKVKEFMQLNNIQNRHAVVI